MRDIAALPKLSLGTLPTPLDPAPRLGAALGLSSLFVKRDDLTGLALGGNKVRKLDYVIADALAQGADTIITAAGPQSNRARMTVAACRRAGLDCILLLCGEYGRREPVGNLMLDAVFGADIRFPSTPDPYSADTLAEARRIADELRAKGRTAYITEVGGVAEPLSDVGYFVGGQELIGQATATGVEPGAVLIACGSGGNQAGVLVALRAACWRSAVIGVCTDPGAAKRAERVRRHAAGLIDWLGLDLALRDDDVIVDDSHAGPGHGPPDTESLDAVRVAARTEGLLLDPVYVGKIVASVPDFIRRGMIDPARPVVLWNTGGIVSLFMHGEAFAHTAAVRGGTSSAA